MRMASQSIPTWNWIVQWLKEKGQLTAEGTARPSYYINGEEPQIVGALCTGFVLLHFYEGRHITDHLNVAHLRLGEQWYRL